MNLKDIDPVQIRKKVLQILPELRAQLAEYLSIRSITGGKNREMDRAPHDVIQRFIGSIFKTN